MSLYTLDCTIFFSLDVSQTTHVHQRKFGKESEQKSCSQSTIKPSHCQHFVYFLLIFSVCRHFCFSLSFSQCVICIFHVIMQPDVSLLDSYISYIVLNLSFVTFTFVTIVLYLSQFSVSYVCSLANCSRPSFAAFSFLGITSHTLSNYIQCLPNFLIILV